VPLRSPPVSPPFPYTTLFRSRNPCSTYGIRHDLSRQPWGSRTIPCETVCRYCTKVLWRFSRSRERSGPNAANTSPSLLEAAIVRSEEHTSELQSREKLVCRLL